MYKKIVKDLHCRNPVDTIQCHDIIQGDKNLQNKNYRKGRGNSEVTMNPILPNFNFNTE